MPALVKVAVEPMAEGMAPGIKIGIEVVHHLSLAFYIVQQVFISYRPGLQALMGRQFAERGGCMSDNGIFVANTSLLRAKLLLLIFTTSWS